ncbi:MAG: hypothetical protein QNL04_09860 [SAR324 cluster bacterium]|nr:hypothetical protein [SAR324 cluster bacterium]
MNSLISIFALFELFNLVKDRYYLQRRERGLIFLGALLPLLDYWFSFKADAYSSTFSHPYFHSFFFMGISCFVVALIHWIYFRNLEKAGTLFFPLIGLTAYFFFTLFSTEQAAFFTPFTDRTFSFNWVLSGYAVPLLLTLLFYGFRFWSGIERGIASKGGLVFLMGFILLMGSFKGLIYLNLPKDFSRAGQLQSEPLNLMQTRWLISLKENDHYVHQVFNLIGGFESNPQKTSLADEVEIFKTLLLEPALAQVYYQEFKNPVVNLSFVHDNILIEITELFPLPELIWIESLAIIKNSSGQTIETKVQRKSFY